MTDAGTNVITGTTYGPANEMLTMTGSVNETRIYNSMLQLKQMYNARSHSLQLSVEQQ